MTFQHQRPRFRASAEPATCPTCGAAIVQTTEPETPAAPAEPTPTDGDPAPGTDEHITACVHLACAIHDHCKMLGRPAESQRLLAGVKSLAQLKARHREALALSTWDHAIAKLGL